MKDKKGEQLAVMANEVARARHSLTVPEQRLVLWLVAQIERDDDAFKEHTLHVTEMQRILGSSNGRAYEQMEAMCDQLQGRILEIHDAGERTRTKHAWLHSARYHDGAGKVTLRFHDLLSPVLLQLKERFCKIPLKAIFQLRGSYAIRWLEMLISQQHAGPWSMSVAELRDWLHIPDKDLEATGHLVSRAIEYPRKELNAKSELSFDFEARRQGKTIVGWTFTPRVNKPVKKPKGAKRLKKAIAATPEPIPSFPPFDGFRQLRETLKASDLATDAPESKPAPARKAKPTKIEPTADELAVHERRKSATQAQLDLIAAN